MSALFADIGLMIVLTGALVGTASSLVGLFLVLRGNAMLSDAVSHSIVLGIVLVWLATGQTAGPVQIVGAGLAGLVTVLLSDALARSRLVRDDAAIGLVFPALFALGVLLISIHARDLHLDVDAVLLGEIGFVWLDIVPVGGAEVPRAVLTLAAMTVVNGAFVALFWKELKLATFDPGLAAALGFAPGVLSMALLGLTSATAVAAFDAVGAILFVAFVIVPPATALLLTDRVGRALVLAVAVSVAASAAGYALALRWDVSIGGMMAVMTGVFFAAAFLLGPRHGLLAQRLRRRAQRDDVACRTLVMHLHSHHATAAAEEENTARALHDHLAWPRDKVRRTIHQALDRGMIRREDGLLAPTEKGRAVAMTAIADAARDDGPPG